MMRLILVSAIVFALSSVASAQTVVHHVSKVENNLLVKSVWVDASGETKSMSKNVALRGLEKIPIAFIEESSVHRMVVEPSLYFVADDALGLRLSFKSHRHPRIDKAMQRQLDRAMRAADFDREPGASYDIWVAREGVVVRRGGVPGRLSNRQGSLYWVMAGAGLLAVGGLWLAFRALARREQDEKIHALLKEAGFD